MLFTKPVFYSRAPKVIEDDETLRNFLGGYHTNTYTRAFRGAFSDINKTACILNNGGSFVNRLSPCFQRMLPGATGCMETSRLSDSDGCQATCVK